MLEGEWTCMECYKVNIGLADDQFKTLRVLRKCDGCKKWYLYHVKDSVMYLASENDRTAILKGGLK